jgi:hypothetical protein
MFKANEMVTFQREKMRLSAQLLHSKALLMDAAPLMIPGEIGYDIAGGGGRQKVAKFSVGLASEKGFCGSEEDLTRAEQLVIDGEMHFNAPSIIHAAAQAATFDDFASSDNRDTTLYFVESLYPTSHMTPREMVIGYLRSGHIHGLMVRAVMSVGSASSPKKGKVLKHQGRENFAKKQRWMRLAEHSGTPAVTCVRSSLSLLMGTVALMNLRWIPSPNERWPRQRSSI